MGLRRERLTAARAQPARHTAVPTVRRVAIVDGTWRSMVSPHRFLQCRHPRLGPRRRTHLVLQARTRRSCHPSPAVARPATCKPTDQTPAAAAREIVQWPWHWFPPSVALRWCHLLRPSRSAAVVHVAAAQTKTVTASALTVRVRGSAWPYSRLPHSKRHRSWRRPTCASGKPTHFAGRWRARKRMSATWRRSWGRRPCSCGSCKLVCTSWRRRRWQAAQCGSQRSGPPRSGWRR